MNATIELLLNRHAIRRYQDKQVEEDALQQVLQAGVYAASAGNNQRGQIVVCQDRAINEELGKLTRMVQFGGVEPTVPAHHVSDEQPSILDDPNIKSGFYGAPTVLHIFTRPGEYCHDDAAMIACNMWHAASALGLGACYIGRAEETFATERGRALRSAWGVEEDLVPVCHLLLGYREGPAPHEKPRRENRILRVTQG